MTGQRDGLKATNIEELPIEVLEYIFLNVDRQSFHQIGRVSRLFRASTESIWERSFKKHFPLDYKKRLEQLKENEIIMWGEAFCKNYALIEKNKHRIVYLIKAGDIEGLKALSEHEELTIKDFELMVGKDETLLDWIKQNSKRAMLDYLFNYVCMLPLRAAGRDTSFDLLYYMVSFRQSFKDVSYAFGDRLIEAFYMAAKEGHLEFITEYIKKIGNVIVSCIDENGFSAFHYACKNGHERIVNFLLDQGADLNGIVFTSGQNGLMLAASNGRTEVVKLLIKYINNLGQISNDGDSNKVDQMRYLNQTNSRGETALSSAAAANHGEIVEILIQAGAKGRFSIPAGHQNYNFELLNILLLNGADPYDPRFVRYFSENIKNWVQQGSNDSDALTTTLLIAQQIRCQEMVDVLQPILEGQSSRQYEEEKEEEKEEEEAVQATPWIQSIFEDLPPEMFFYNFEMIPEIKNLMSLSEVSDHIILADSDPKCIFTKISHLPPHQVMAFIRHYRKSDAFLKLQSKYLSDPTNMQPYEILCYALTTNDVKTIQRNIPLFVEAHNAVMRDGISGCDEKTQLCLIGLSITIFLLDPTNVKLTTTENIINTDFFINLSGIDLRGDKINLLLQLKKHLKEVNFEGANLQGVNLQGIDLQGTNLEGANLQGANLENANLQNTNLQRTNLQQATLNLTDAYMQKADLTGANLLGAIIIRKALFDEPLVSFSHSRKKRKHPDSQTLFGSGIEEHACENENKDEEPESKSDPKNRKPGTGT